MRGYFDTDGNLFFAKRKSKNYSKFKRNRHYYPRISLSTVSQSLANEVNWMLRGLEFNTCYSEHSPKSSRENKKYRIELNGVKNLNKWLKIVGIKNDTKSSRLKIWQKYGFCPTKLTQKERLKILKGKKDPHDYYIGPMM